MVRAPSTRVDGPSMRLSRYFLPVLKEAPAEAEIVSHKLMLRAGMIQQLSAGIYNWLPLGFAVLQKVEQIVREEMNAAGAIEILMPTIQPADLWRESGRYEAYGKEMLRIRDRHERDMLYGPTNEENVTDIFRRHVKSYRQLPLNLYHIQWKFRDEIRPRFGVMRGREFLMKDAYSFDVDYEAARRAYDNMFLAYLKTFKRMGLTAIPMQAETGPIGGNMSHEFQILAQTGESAVFYDAAFEEIDFSDPDLDAGAAEGALRRRRREARPGRLSRPGRPAALRPRHRGRPHLLLRHQVLGGHGGHRHGPGRCRGAGRDGLLRHRRLAPGRRPDRGVPRREGDRLARERGAVPDRPGQPAARRCRDHRPGGGPLRPAARRRRRRADGRPRRARRRQVRDHGADRPALAGRRRPAGCRRGPGRAEEPGHRREGGHLAGRCCVERFAP